MLPARTEPPAACPAGVPGRFRRGWEAAHKNQAPGVSPFTPRRRRECCYAPARSEGPGSFWSRASIVVVTHSRPDQSCWRHLSIAERCISTKRLPPALCVPKNSLPQMTARRSDRAAALLVGATPSWLTQGPMGLCRSSRLPQSITGRTGGTVSPASKTSNRSPAKSRRWAFIIRRVTVPSRAQGQ